MKTNSNFFKKNFSLTGVIIFMTFFISVNSSLLYAQTFKLFAVSDLSRVYEDGYKLPATGDTIKMFGIRGEVLSGQCAFISTKDLTSVTAEVSQIRNTSTNDIIPLGNVEWDFVGSIPLPNNTPSQPLYIVERPAPARYPDYLMAEKQINLAKKIYQSVWLTITIPENASTGVYTGSVTVKTAQGQQSIPISITVYPLTLTPERNLKVTQWHNTGSFVKFHGINDEYSDAWFAMLKKYADNMAAHRQNVFRVPMMSTIEIQKTKDNKLLFDFSRFDQIADVFWNTGKMDYLETGFLTSRGELRWASTEIFLSEFSNVKDQVSGNLITLPGEEVIPQLLPAFESHLRDKGWLDKTYFHVMDEPSHHNAIPWMEMSAYMKYLAPDLIRMDAIETYLITDELEVAVPKLGHFVTWYDEWKKAQEKGTELWFYTVGTIDRCRILNKTIDLPLIHNRLLHWLNYKYDAVGYLKWGWNSWTDDPYNEVGRHLGDGWNVYPVKDGVLNSLRWEQMRNGIQEYEYFLMLEKKVAALKDSLGARFSWINPKQMSKGILNQVIQEFEEYSTDPEVLYKAKMQIINELLNFDKSPLLYVETNPVEYTAISSQTRVGICGWAEPGSKVFINETEVPVSQQGMFLKIVSLTPRYSSLRIKAENSAGSKEIVRHFTIIE